MTDILPVSVLLSNGTLWGFLLRYITLSYLNWHENGEPSKFEVQLYDFKNSCSPDFFQVLTFIEQNIFLPGMEE